MASKKNHLLIEKCSANKVIIHCYENYSAYWVEAKKWRFMRRGAVERVISEFEEYCKYKKDDYIIVETLNSAKKLARNKKPLYALMNRLNALETSELSRLPTNEIRLFEGGPVELLSPSGVAWWSKIGEVLEFHAGFFSNEHITVDKYGDFVISKYNDESGFQPIASFSASELEHCEKRIPLNSVSRFYILKKWYLDYKDQLPKKEKG